MRTGCFAGCFVGWKEIAAYFSIHQDTARRWHQKWGLPISRIGRRPIAYPEKLREWVEQNKEKK